MTIKDDLLDASGNPEALSRAIALKFKADRDRLDLLESGVIVAAVASAVADLGTTTNIPVSNFTAVDAANPTKAEIDVGINALRTAAEARLDAIEAKIDAALDSLRTAGIIAT